MGNKINSPLPPCSTSVQFPGTPDNDPCPSDLHFSNFVGLEFRCTVVVNEANTTCKLPNKQKTEAK